MNDPIDSLKVLVEADYSGLKVQLQQAMGLFENFLSEVNEGQVNWVNILQGSFTPALIATIASAFAMSIENALNLQNTLASVGAQIPSAIGGGISVAAGQVDTMVNSTGQSATDLAGTFGAMMKQFNGNSDAATEVTDALGQLATMGVAPLSELTDQAVGLFQAWNVTTGTQGVAALNGLYQAFQAGHLSWQQLTSDLTNVGVPLATTNTTIAKTAQAMSSLSTVPGQTAATVQTAFNSIATAVQTPQDPLNKLNTSFGSIMNDINEAGISQALDDISKDMQGPLTRAQALGAAIGLTPDAVTAFNKLSTGVFDSLIKAQDSVIANQNTIDKSFKQFQQNAPTVGLWNQISAWFGQAGLSVADLVTNPSKFLSDIENPGTPSPEINTATGIATAAQDIGSFAAGPVGTAIATNGTSVMTQLLQQILQALTGSGKGGTTSITNINVPTGSVASQKITQGASMVQASGGNTASNY